MDQVESIILSDDDQDDSMPDIFRQNEIMEDVNVNPIPAPDPYGKVNADQQDNIQTHGYNTNTAEATPTSENLIYGAANDVQNYHYIQASGSEAYLGANPQPSGSQAYLDSSVQPSGSQAYLDSNLQPSSSQANLDENFDENEGEETGKIGKVCEICGEKRLRNVAHQCPQSQKKKGRKRVLAQTSDGEYMCSNCPYISERYRTVYQHCKNLGHKILKSSNETMGPEKVQIVEKRNKPIPIASLANMQHPPISITNGTLQLNQPSRQEGQATQNQEGVIPAFATEAELVGGDENADHMIGLDDLDDDMQEEIPSQKKRAKKPKAPRRGKCPVDPNSPDPKELPDGQYQCNFCKFKSRQEPSIVKHQWKHTNFYPYKCVACQNPLRHIYAHKCKVTGETGNKKNVVPFDSQPGPSTMTPGTRRANEANNLVHEETDRTSGGSAAADQNYPRPIRGEDGLYRCNFCDFKNVYYQTTSVHQWKHTTNKPHKCHVCKKSFAKKALLTKHVCRLSNPVFRAKIKIEPKTEPTERPQKPPVSAAAGRPNDIVGATEENSSMQTSATSDQSITPPIVIAPPMAMNPELPIDAHLSIMEIPPTTHPSSSGHFYVDSAGMPVQCDVSQLSPKSTAHSVQVPAMSQPARNDQLPSISSQVPPGAPFSVSATSFAASSQESYIDFTTEMPVGDDIHTQPEYDTTTTVNSAPVQSSIAPASVLPQASTVSGPQYSQMSTAPHPASAFEQTGMSLTDAVVIPDDELEDPTPSNLSMEEPSRTHQMPLSTQVSTPVRGSDDIPPMNAPAPPAATRPSNSPQVPPAPQISPGRNTMMTQPRPTPTSNLYNCQLCKIYFEDQNMYKTHMDHHGQNVGSCAKCSGYFRTPLAFFNHMECYQRPQGMGPASVAMNNPEATNTPRGSFRGRRPRLRGSRGRGSMDRLSSQSTNSSEFNRQGTSQMNQPNSGFRQPPPHRQPARNPNLRQDVSVNQTFQGQNTGAQIPAASQATPNRMGQPTAHGTSRDPNRQLSPMSQPNQSSQQLTPARLANDGNRQNNVANRASGPPTNQMTSPRPGNHPPRLTGITPIHRSPTTTTANSPQVQQQVPQRYNQSAQNTVNRQSTAVRQNTVTANRQIHQRPHASHNVSQNAQTSQQMLSPSQNVAQTPPQMTRVVPNPLRRTSQNMPQKPVTQTSPQLPPQQMPSTSRNVPRASPQMTSAAANQMPLASRNVAQMPAAQTSSQIHHEMRQTSQHMTQIPSLEAHQMPQQNVAQVPMPQTSPQMSPHQMSHNVPHTSTQVAPQQLAYVSGQPFSDPSIAPPKPRQVARRGRPLNTRIPQHQPSTSHVGQQNSHQPQYYPQTQQFSSHTQQHNPQTQQNNPQTQQNNSQTQQNNPQTQKNNSQTQQFNPHTQQNNPQTQQLSPQTLQYGRQAQQSNPQRQQYGPQTQYSPQTQQYNPQIQQQGPQTQQYSHQTPQTPSFQQNQNNMTQDPGQGNVIVID